MSVSAPPRQLAFALPHAESFSRDDFLDGPCNATGLALIERWPDWPSRIMMLVGAEGSGKSHLAAIWAKDAGARVTAAHTLTAATVPAELATSALVVEDVDPATMDERALFHLLNLAREHEAFVLMTARQPPSTFEIGLRDLRSRLRALPVVTLAQPDDGLFRAVIVKLGADRQMQLDEPVVSYLASRIERSFVAAREAVARLDAEALRLGRPITRALAADVLRQGAASSDER